MSKLYAKIKSRIGGNKYRIFLDVEDESIYCNKADLVKESVIYNPSTLIEKGAWYRIEEFSKKPFSIDIITQDYSDIDFPSLSREEYDSLDYIFEISEHTYYFQNVGKAKLLRKKGILRLGNNFRYHNDYSAIPLCDIPDAIYDRNEDVLYFTNLSSITHIFPGISDLYREATAQEVELFLKQDFIVVGTDFSVEKVKTPNRKRIALVMELLGQMKKNEKKKICSYISDYCPSLKNDESSFNVTNDEELTMLLYGIDQRFYTTLIGKEKRIANSVIKMTS